MRSAPLLRPRLAAAVSVAYRRVRDPADLALVRRGGEHCHSAWAILIARFVLPAIVAASDPEPDRVLDLLGLRRLEYVLFGGLTVLLIVAQYTINLCAHAAR